MKKTTILFIWAAFFTGPVCLCSQTALPYSTGFDNAAQMTNWSTYRTGAIFGGSWSPVSFVAFSTPSCVAHGYPSGGTGTVTVKDWFVSPAFNFAAGGKIDSVRARFSGGGAPLGFDVPGVADTIAIYLLQGSSNPAMATVKTLLFDFRGANYIEDHTWRKFSNIVIPATPGQSYIAFYYRDTNRWLDAYFDNFSVSSNGSAPVATFSLSASTICKGKPLDCMDQSTNSATSWNWTFSGGSPATSTLSNPSVTFASSGTHTITLTSSNGFGASAAVSKTVSVAACTGISLNTDDSFEWNVFPNPTQGDFFIRLQEKGNYRYIMYNAAGEEIDKGLIEQEELNLNLRSYPEGIYFLKVDNGIIQRTTRLIKE